MSWFYNKTNKEPLATNASCVDYSEIIPAPSANAQFIVCGYVFALVSEYAERAIMGLKPECVSCPQILITTKTAPSAYL